VCCKQLQALFVAAERVDGDNEAVIISLRDGSREALLLDILNDSDMQMGGALQVGEFGTHL